MATRRNEVVRLRVTVGEKQEIERLAKAAGLGMSDYIRGVVLGTAFEDGAIEEPEPTATRIAQENEPARAAVARSNLERQVEQTRGPRKVPTSCPQHPDAGKLKTGGKTYCDYPLCRFEYS